MSVFYASLFCGLPWLLFFVAPSCFPRPSWSLFFLQIYGSFWSGWATTSTKITSSAISKIIDNNIIPELSAETARAIEGDLRRRFQMRQLLLVSRGIAVLGATLAGYLVYRDESAVSEPSIGEIFWWSLGWALLFATAAKVVNVSRFYGVFAAHLEDDPRKLYALDPARSTLVTSVASVAQAMLLFWFGIAVSIALVIPFGAMTSPDFIGSPSLSLFKIDLPHNSFALVDILITGFFSIGLGTIVFLRSESAIRQAVKTATRSKLRLIETEVANLTGSLKYLDEADWKRLAALSALHKDLAAAGSYRSLVVSGLSVMVPFVIPFVTLLQKLLT